MSGQNQDINVNDSVIDGDITTSVRTQNEYESPSINLNDSVVIGDVTQIINDEKQINHLIDEKVIPNLHNKIVNSINRRDWEEASFCITEIHETDYKIVSWWDNNHTNKSLIEEWISLIKGQLELQLIEDENVDTFYIGLELLKRILSNYSNDGFAASILLIELYNYKIDYHLDNSISQNNLSYNSVEKEFNNAHLSFRKFLTDEVIIRDNTDIKNIRKSKFDKSCNKFRRCVNASVKMQRVFTTFYLFIAISILLASAFAIIFETGILACYGILVTFLLVPMYERFRELKNNVRTAKKLVLKINTIQSKL